MLEKIEKKRNLYLKRRSPSRGVGRKREAKAKEKQERNTGRIGRMVLTLGSKLKTVKDAEHVKNVQLKLLRKQAKRPVAELANDDRVIGMMQCYHLFRTLCRV